MNAYPPKTGALLWLAMMLIVAALGSRILTRDWLETGFLALLPASEQDPEAAAAILRHNGQRDRHVIWLTGAPTSTAAIGLAKQLRNRLQESGLFKTLVLELPLERTQQRYQALFAYRYQLLSRDTYLSIRHNPQDFLTRNLATLNSPMGQSSVMGLEHDPLLLFDRYFHRRNALQPSLEQGIITIKDNGLYWTLLLSDLANPHLPLDQLEALLGLTNTAKANIGSQGGRLMVSGMPLFTAQGADAAKQEISTVGVGSSLGIIVLMLLTFRSGRPLLLSFVAIGCGLFAAIVVSVWVFGKIHIITLIFGASLIGVADDYALHFVCDSFGNKYWLPRHAVRYLFPGLLIGLITNLLSYAGLALSPFPGLQQVAVFSATGLLVAWLSVVLIFPLGLTHFKPSHRPVLLKLAAIWQEQWPRWVKRHRRRLVFVLALFMSGGLWQLTPRDDVRLLQAPPAELLASADKIKKILPITTENQFFLVSGDTLESWHDNEQHLLAALQNSTRQRQLTSYRGISDHWPSERDQQANYRLLDETFYRSGLLSRYMSDLGFDDKAIRNEVRRFADAKDRTLSLDAWLESADEDLKNLWLGCDAKGCRSMVSLTGIVDPEALISQQNLPGIRWIDQVDQLSGLFAQYRVRGSLLLAGAYLLVLIGLGFKFGWRHAGAIISIPIVSALVSLAMIGWFNQLFSLFNLFALLLVLGIGIDDAIFFYMADVSQTDRTTAGLEYDDKRTSTSLAVTLSAFTTLLAFGLLAVSSTEIVHAFGFTVATGIFTALLCSPLIGSRRI